MSNAQPYDLVADLLNQDRPLRFTANIELMANQAFRFEFLFFFLVPRDNGQIEKVIVSPDVGFKLGFNVTDAVVLKVLSDKPLPETVKGLEKRWLERNPDLPANLVDFNQEGRLSRLLVPNASLNPPALEVLPEPHGNN